MWQIQANLEATDALLQRLYLSLGFADEPEPLPPPPGWWYR